MVKPCAAGDRPDRRVTLGGAGQETRTGRIPAQAIDSRTGNRDGLFPGRGLEDSHVVAAARREPATVEVEGERRKIRSVAHQLSEQSPARSVPDVHDRARCVDRSNELAVGRERHEMLNVPPTQTPHPPRPTARPPATPPPQERPRP